MATHTMTLGVDGSGIFRSKKITSTGGGVNLIDGETVADGQTDKVVNFDLDFSACTMFYIESDQTITVKTNSSGAPDDTLSLVADVPYVWQTNSLDTFLITADIITGLFVTNASGSTATIYCVALYDVTP